MSLRKIPRAAGKHRQATDKPSKHRRGWKNGRARRREFNRERKAIETATDLDDRDHIRVGPDQLSRVDWRESEKKRERV